MIPHGVPFGHQPFGGQPSPPVCENCGGPLQTHIERNERTRILVCIIQSTDAPCLGKFAVTPAMDFSARDSMTCECRFMNNRMPRLSPQHRGYNLRFLTALEPHSVR